MGSRLDISNKQIIDLYFNKNLNRRQTAETLNCSQDLIAYRLKQMNLKPKNMSSCVSSGKVRSILLPKDLINVFDGEMLGDGGLIRYKDQGSFRESFGHDKKEWADYLFNILLVNNIPFVGNKIFNKKPSGKSKNMVWQFATKNVLELGELHKKWYVKNNNFDCNIPFSFKNRKFIKTVPSDIVLTQKCLLHWYIGDGAVNDSGGCMLHTEGFSWSEVEFLRFRLKEDFNILSSHNKKNTIYIPCKERIKLIEIIKSCPVQCYEYKWANLNYSSKDMPFNSHIDMKAVEQFIKN